LGMEERYRTPGRRKRDPLAEELGKFTICYALSEHACAEGGGGRPRRLTGLDVTGIKEGIFREILREGDVVEGEGILSPYSAIYQPRAYYPAYVMGEMRAALRRGEEAPTASPHYLPVSLLPALPDGWRVAFLYPAGKRSFERPDFPAHLRDVLTRDYQRMPFLLPPGMEPRWGGIGFRARLMKLSRETMRRLAGMGEDAYLAYAARGLVHFLVPEELEAVPGEVAPRGSLFAEVSFAEIAPWERACLSLEASLREAVEEAFPPCARGEREEAGCYLPRSGHHVFRFRSRLFAVVYDPVIAVMRAPALLGIYLPADLGETHGEAHSRFQRLVERLLPLLESGLQAPLPARVEVAYDNRLPWAREREALSGPLYQQLENRYTFLGPTLRWLRGC